MTRCYLDTNFLYAHLRTPSGEDVRVERWREAAMNAMADDPAVISPLVIDELAYRMLLGWLRDERDPDPLSTFRADPGGTARRMRTKLRRLWRDIDRLRLEVVSTDRPVVDRAQRFMTDPGMAPRDAFHAASALHSECRVAVSADPVFDLVPRLQRLGPA